MGPFKFEMFLFYAYLSDVVSFKISFLLKGAPLCYIPNFRYDRIQGFFKYDEKTIVKISAQNTDISSQSKT